MRLTPNPPDEVLRIARTLEKAGYETWCVGGGVRDALLGHQDLDWDLATAARPQQVRGLFPKTVPVGIEFGTVGVLDANAVMHEVTTFRRDVHTDGRHAVVDFGASLDEDLARRDFTINAIAYSPATGEMRDPFDGRADLERRVIRAVGEPAERLREDRLRGLRAIRFAARFAFAIEPRTWEAIVDSAPHLMRLSAERVKQEIDKTMEQVSCPSAAFRMWRDSGSLRVLIPAIAAVTDQQLAALDCTRPPLHTGKPGRKIARLCVLFSTAPGADVGDILKRLRFSNSDAAWIVSVIQRWHALEGNMREMLARTDPPGDAQLRRWAATAGRTRFASVLRLAEAHWCAGRAISSAVPSRERVASVYRRALRIAYRDPIEVADIAVNGRDLERIGIAGPQVGIILRSLLEIVINDPASNSAQVLLELARAQIAQSRCAKDEGGPQL